MTERRIREALRRASVPDEDGAEQRARRVVRAAFDADRAVGAGRHARRLSVRPLIALAVAALAVVAALTPPGEAVGDWIADGLRTQTAPSSPALTSLPTGGRLLVTSSEGPWVVQRDGSRRRLGDYAEAGWSPNGLFVVASRARQLTALEPDGSVRWTLGRPGPVGDAVWSPDGFRIAYRSGSSLRVVAGDGTGDARLATADPVRPAWRPGAEHVLAYVNRLGTVVVRRADTRPRLWRARVPSRPTQLLWSRDGSRLVVVSRTGVEVFDGAGPGAVLDVLPPGARATAATINPVTGDLALVRHRPGARRGEVVTVPLDGEGDGPRARTLFAGGGRFSDLAWSPDGRWLLVAWRDADQWLFIRSGRARAGSSQVRRVRAVSNIARQFDPGGTSPRAFPRIGGWCC